MPKISPSESNVELNLRRDIFTVVDGRCRMLLANILIFDYDIAILDRVDAP